jgi:RNase P/RNase MRP subunit POP5
MNTKLEPSNRIKKRYLLLKGIDKEDLEKLILDYIGILGWSRASPSIISKSEGIILAINRKELDNVKAALELSKINLKLIAVSGTLAGLKRKV